MLETLAAKDISIQGSQLELGPPTPLVAQRPRGTEAEKKRKNISEMLKGKAEKLKQDEITRRMYVTQDQPNVI